MTSALSISAAAELGGVTVVSLRMHGSLLAELTATSFCGLIPPTAFPVEFMLFFADVAEIDAVIETARFSRRACGSFHSYKGC